MDARSISLITVMVLLWGCSTNQSSSPVASPISSAASSTESRNPALATAEGLEAFQELYKVAIHERCTNCHVKGDRPLQFDGSYNREHAQNIHRGFTKLGHSCQTCHQDHNLPLAHQPPGAHNWNLPAPRKGYHGKAATAFARLPASPVEVCDVWTNKSRNFFESGPNKDKGRTSAELLEHITTDPLVIWAWNPGKGREPAPGTHEQFRINFAKWVTAGAPCPAN